MNSFSNFPLSESILKALQRMNYTQPTAIQNETIPYILAGKHLIALAQTGSGKTAACAIPLCNNIDIDCKLPQVLVVVPTRELALQYATEAQKIGKDHKVSAFALFGGEDYGIQRSKLKHGVQFLVATPGRLIDLIHTRDIDLSSVKTLVLDEADEMLSMGFYDDLEFIIECLVQKPQILLFSATMPKQIRSIAMKHMSEPVEISLIPEQASPNTLDHFFIWCAHHKNKVSTLLDAMAQLVPKQAIIFCKSRDECEMVYGMLKQRYPLTDYLHAGQSQEVRTIVTNKFRTKKISFLVATDIASRGLDFSGITHVFIYHLSKGADIYLHRSGRTGRNEQKGVVVTIVTEKELAAYERIIQHIGVEGQWLGEKPSATPGLSNQKRKSYPPQRSRSRKPNRSSSDLNSA